MKITEATIIGIMTITTRAGKTVDLLTVTIPYTNGKGAGFRAYEVFAPAGRSNLGGTCPIARYDGQVVYVEI